jgi:hypothetical protein
VVSPTLFRVPLPRPRLASPTACRTALAATLLLVSTSCTGDDGGTGKPAASPTPITDLKAADVVLARADFCDRIPDESVTAAVGEVATTEHYGNGEKEQITPEVTDVAHEFDCTFVGESGAVARAWVFVPRVTRGQAKDLVRSVKDTRGCRLVDGQGFGSPGTGSVCTTKAGTEAAYRGLFTDAWFTCTLTADDLDEPTLLKQAGQWCVSSAAAASAG